MVLYDAKERAERLERRCISFFLFLSGKTPMRPFAYDLSRLLVPSTLGGFCFPGLNQSHDIGNLPKSRGYARSHGGRHPQLRMNANEIVIHHVTRDGPYRRTRLYFNLTHYPADANGQTVRARLQSRHLNGPRHDKHEKPAEV